MKRKRRLKPIRGKVQRFLPSEPLLGFLMIKKYGVNKNLTYEEWLAENEKRLEARHKRIIAEYEREMARPDRTTSKLEKRDNS